MNFRDRLLSILSSKRMDEVINLMLRFVRKPDESYYDYRMMDISKGYSTFETLGFKNRDFETYNFTPKYVFRLVSAASISIRVRDGIRFIKNLSRFPNIYSIDIVKKYRLTLNKSVPMIHGDKAWDYGYEGKNIRIAVLDSGIDSSHPDLKGKVVYSASFVSDEDDKDYNGHGTHVAGIIAGNGDKYRGVAPKAQLVNAKCGDKYGFLMEDNVAAAIETIVLDNLADILNMSFGGSYDENREDILVTLVDLVVGVYGKIVCVAAGNSGPNPHTIESPGVAIHGITVGAVDQDYRIAPYSSRGPGPGGILKPEVVAPGGDPNKGVYGGIISALSSNIPEDLRKEYEPRIVDDIYVSLCGTSMATPHVSGACALLLEVVRENSIAHSTEIPFIIKNVLERSARNLGYDKYAQGFGLIDIENAIKYMRSERIKAIGTKSSDFWKEIIESISISGLLSSTIGAMTYTAFSELLSSRTSSDIDRLRNQIIKSLKDVRKEIIELDRQYQLGLISLEEYKNRIRELSLKVERAERILNYLDKYK